MLSLFFLRLTDQCTTCIFHCTLVSIGGFLSSTMTFSSHHHNCSYCDLICLFLFQVPCVLAFSTESSSLLLYLLLFFSWKKKKLKKLFIAFYKLYLHSVYFIVAWLFFLPETTLQVLFFQAQQLLHQDRTFKVCTYYSENVLLNLIWLINNCISVCLSSITFDD